MDIRQLQVILHVCETKSVTETARRLYVSQPAISKTIKQVEELTGLVLFENIQGRLIPSVQAQSLLPVIKQLLKSHEDVKKHILNLQTGKAGVIRIAVSPSLMPTIVASTISKFQARRPEVEVKLVMTSTRDIFNRVGNHEVDFGICQTYTGDSAVKVLPLTTGIVLCALPRNHPLIGKKKITPSDLEGEKIITFPDTEPTAGMILDAFTANGVTLSRSIEVNQSFGACSLVNHGLGVALVDSFIHVKDHFPALTVKPFSPEIKLELQFLTSSVLSPSQLTQELMKDLFLVGKQYTYKR